MEDRGVESVDAGGRHPGAQSVAAEIEGIGTEIVKEKDKGNDKERGREIEAGALEGLLQKGTVSFLVCIL